MGINIENLTKLINHLKKINKKNFDMALWYIDTNSNDSWFDKPATELVTKMERGMGDCGTAACIAGHVAVLEAAERQVMLTDMKYAEDIAQEWLGLSDNQAHRLFKPGVSLALGGGEIHNHSLPKALAVLERLKETAEAGKPVINWKTTISRKDKQVAS